MEGAVAVAAHTVPLTHACVSELSEFVSEEMWFTENECVVQKHVSCFCGCRCCGVAEFQLSIIWERMRGVSSVVVSAAFVLVVGVSRVRCLFRVSLAGLSQLR